MAILQIRLKMKSKGIQWLCVFILADLGILMGVLSVNGYTQRIEPYLWFLFAIISAYVLFKKVRKKLFLHGLLIGLLWAVINALIQAFFFDSYMENNPRDAEIFEQVTFMPAQYFILLFSPLYGLVLGFIVGALAVAFNRFFKK